MKKIIIKENEKNKTIKYVIQKRFPHLSLNTLNKAFRKGDIKFNKKAISQDYIVNPFDEISIYIIDELLYNIKKDIDVYYEDENILVAYKPRGVFSCKVGGEKKDNLYFDELVKNIYGDNLSICHRLDTNTEGLVIFSKNITAHKELLEAFKESYITKCYLTLVHSKPNKDSEKINAYILEDPKTSFVKVIDKEQPGSTKISTTYNLIKYYEDKNLSILEVFIHTGKTHQIRAHMKKLGLFVIGDSKYTPNEINRKYKLKYQVLYAVSYSFNFPCNCTLNYLNNIKVDVSNICLKNIQNLIK